jgi:hypothetical protein
MAAKRRHSARRLEAFRLPEDFFLMMLCLSRRNDPAFVLTLDIDHDQDAIPQQTHREYALFAVVLAIADLLVGVVFENPGRLRK